MNHEPSSIWLPREGSTIIEIQFFFLITNQSNIKEKIENFIYLLSPLPLCNQKEKWLRKKMEQD